MWEHTAILCEVELDIYGLSEVISSKLSLPVSRFTTWLKMPKSVEEEYFQQAHEQYQQLIKTLTEKQTQGWEHGEIESYINNSGTELLRRLLQGHLDLRYAQEEYQSELMGTDGEKRPHRRKKTQRKLETLFGEVVVNRVGYSTQKLEVSALYPADGKLNLPPDKYSDGLVVG